jgi:RNA polymerase sigma-70 factor (ECF subfamily)
VVVVPIPQKYLSPPEVGEAIKSLQDHEKSQLVKVAKSNAPGTHYTYEDLLQECFVRVLEGRRPWPRAIPLVAFLGGVIRSIAWDKRRRELSEQPALADLASAACDPIAESKSKVREIVNLFSDDPIAQIILKGMMEGLRGREAQKASGLDETGYESKRKKIRRRIERYRTTGRE